MAKVQLDTKLQEQKGFFVFLDQNSEKLVLSNRLYSGGSYGAFKKDRLDFRSLPGLLHTLPIFSRQWSTNNAIF